MTDHEVFDQLTARFWRITSAAKRTLLTTAMHMPEATPASHAPPGRAGNE